MATPTLDELLDSPSKEQIEAELRSSLARSEFPVTDWSVGGVVNTMVMIEREVLEDLISQAIPKQIAGGWADAEEPVGAWLTIVARGLYDLEREVATFPSQSITLACASGSGPYVVTTGQFLVTATDGRVYVATSGGTLAGGGTLSITVKAQAPGQARGLVNATAATMKGVTVTAAAIQVISSVSQFGADEETDVALQGRCADRWPSLTVPSEVERLERWVKTPTEDLEDGDDEKVTRVRLDADPDNAGGVIVTVAGGDGAVGSDTVDDAQAYVDERVAITDYVTVQDAENLIIVTGGTVTVPAALLERIQEVANDAWVAFLLGVQIGGVVPRAELVQAVMDAGAIDFVDVELNANGDVALASDQVPTPNDTLANELTWVSV